MTDIAYSIKNLVKKYDKAISPANDNLSIDIERGKIFGIFGPNGAGKTTLIRQMAGLTKPTSGTIILNGFDVVKHPNVIPHFIAYYAQTPWILWNHRVWEALYFTGIFRGLSKKEAKMQTEALLAQLGLSDIHNQIMDRISGGQKKILGIGTCLIGSREVLILDEPTNELDPINRSKLWSLLMELCREKNKTIILVTHNIFEAEQVVDNVMIIDKGKIIAHGTPGELKQKVDDRVRIEVKFKNHISMEEQHNLYQFQGVKQLQSGKWQIMIPKNDISQVFNQIIDQIGINSLDDFRVITTTLEDVYIQMGGSLDELSTSQ